mgnify:CR=1 FL=1
MKISISEAAREQLKENEGMNLKILLRGYGWGGPVFGVAQVEPEEEDKIVNVDGFDVAVEPGLDGIVNNFQIDYRRGLFQKGFVVYADGSSGEC